MPQRIAICAPPSPTARSARTSSIGSTCSRWTCPLRERRSDVLLLVEYFIHRYAKRIGKRIRRVTKEAARQLHSYDWPGNIRELQNVIERAVIVCRFGHALDRCAVALRSVPRDPAGRRLSTGTLAIQEKDAIEVALAGEQGPCGRTLRRRDPARRACVDAGVEDQGPEDRQAAL